MVKDHSDSERGNPLPPHRLLFPINQQGFFYMHHPTDRITHTTAFVAPGVVHWLERETVYLMSHICMYVRMYIFIYVFTYNYVCLYVCI